MIIIAAVIAVAFAFGIFMGYCAAYSLIGGSHDSE
jgi:hypothetical protein